MRLLLKRNQDHRALKFDILMVETDYKKGIRRATAALKVGTVQAERKEEEAGRIPVDESPKPIDVAVASSPVDKGLKLIDWARCPRNVDGLEAIID